MNTTQLDKPNLLTYYNYCKIYPSKTLIYEFQTSKTINLDTYENTQPINTNKQTQTNNKQNETNLERSLRRTKTTIKDYILTNNFEYFVTFTIAKNRNDTKKSLQKIKNYFQNQKYKNKLTYLVIPEYHKDGTAIHFHAVITGLKQQNLKYSGHLINSRKAYNITNYKSGFNTAIKIDNTDKVANYITKYVTKELITNPNKKRFYASNNLQKPIIKYNVNISPAANIVFATQDLNIYSINDEHDKLKVPLTK